MTGNREGERTLSQFGEAWVSQPGAAQPPTSVGWYLWMVVAVVTVLFALVGLLSPGV
ncbi:MAG: hypothetical protein HY060_04660 [Proteobacteria bacterium]|nr:hypothetical protein [Pseudomonadota bacterium]